MADRLTLETICRTALHIGDTEGLDHLSMRRLATEFGVTPMALYSHVATKDDLLNAMTDLALDEIEVPAGGSADWKERAVSLVQVLRECLRRHPAVIRIVSQRWVASQSVGLARLLEHVLHALHEGFETDEQVDEAFALLYKYTFGYVAFELPRGSVSRQGLESIAIERGFTNFARHAEAFKAALASEQFASGAHALLSGLEARARV
jgi:AcrR family transcriptional regulator